MRQKSRFTLELISLMGLLCGAILTSIWSVAASTPCNTWEKNGSLSFSFDSANYELRKDTIFFTSANASVEIYRQADDHPNQIQIEIYSISETPYYLSYGTPICNFTLANNQNYTRVNFTAGPIEYVFRGICTPSIIGGHSLIILCNYFSLYPCADTPNSGNQTTNNNSTNNNYYYNNSTTNATRPDAFPNEIGINLAPWILGSVGMMVVCLIVFGKKKKHSI